jgi:hypothetical protein
MPASQGAAPPQPSILNAKSIQLTITLGDITEEELRVLELIEVERREQMKSGSLLSWISGIQMLAP